MSLFVGNISKTVDFKTLQKAFRSHGECSIDYRKRYAFVQYQSDHSAEQAMRALHNKLFGGLSLKIAWSHKSGKVDQRRRGGDWDTRSMSWEKRRKSPKYQADFEFEPDCPRDLALLKFLRERRQRARERERKREERREEIPRRAPSEGLQDGQDKGRGGGEGRQSPPEAGQSRL